MPVHQLATLFLKMLRRMKPLLCGILRLSVGSPFVSSDSTVISGFAVFFVFFSSRDVRGFWPRLVNRLGISITTGAELLTLSCF